MRSRAIIDQAIFVALVLLAVVMRVWNLGSMPLRADEAAVALQSWALFQGLPSTVEFGPVITYGNALIFALFGANDASARILPALAGVVLVALCYFCRPYVGRRAAIASAFLLAISPTAVFFSRTVGSEMIAAAALFSSTILFFRHLSQNQGAYPAFGSQEPSVLNGTSGDDIQGQNRDAALGDRVGVYLYGCAAALGVAVCASPAGVVGLVTFVSFVGVLSFVRKLGGKRRLPTLRSGHEAMDGGSVQYALGLDLPVIRKAVLVFGAVAVLVATGVLSNLHGIQEALISQMALLLGSPGYSPAYYIQIMLIYETLVVVFAFARVFYSRRAMGLFSWFLVWWAVVSLIFYSLWPQKSPSLILQVLVPGILLAGEGIGEVLGWLEAERLFRHLGIFAAFTIPLVVLTVLSLSFFSLPEERMRWEVALVPPLVLALSVAGFAQWRGIAETIRLGSLCLLGLLLAAYVHVGSNLNFVEGPNPAELYEQGATVQDVRTLAADVTDLVQVAGGSRGAKDVFVDSSLKYPLAWYLRHLDGVEYGAEPGGNSRIVIAADGKWTGGTAQQGSQQADGRYLSHYIVSAYWKPWELDLGTLWRWLVYREPGGPVEYGTAAVRVR